VKEVRTLNGKFISAIFVGAVMTLVAALSCVGQGQTTKPPAPATPSSVRQPPQQQTESSGRTPSAAEKYFSDVELLDQDGRRLRFYSDVLKDKVVVINTFFSTCSSVCPPLNRNFEKIQEALGDRLGRQVFLVSISVDPGVDTPTRLKEYSQKFHARPGWIFLTGKKENVDWALYKLGQYVEKRDDHTTIVIMGNEPKGLWKKAHGLANSAELIKMVEDVLNDK
jgi:protein SCO1